MRSKFLSKIGLGLALAFGGTSVQAGTFVHLFEWKWTDIAYECENHLSQAGYTAVQVSPPNKHIDGAAWWTRYQPVSYEIDSRSGSRSEFINMVNRCNAVGVGIYVDAVINHMAAWDFNFPLVPYGPNDFHSCRDIPDWFNTSAFEMRNCGFNGLNDLRTENDYVRQKIAEYLNSLIDIGVAGFRIDAAKHMNVADIQDILYRLNKEVYIYQEVIGDNYISALDYTGNAAVTEFRYTNTIGTYFKGRSPLSNLRNIGTWSGWVPSDQAVTFVANHDNQRQDTSNIITHKDGMNTLKLANIFSLGWPYGYPKVMSSYEWSNHDQGPPSHGASSCSNGWLCEHRDTTIENMVEFRALTDSAPYHNDWWDNGNNQIAFARGELGFVAINGESGSTMNVSLQTSLPAGIYCDVARGDFVNGNCTGPTVQVISNGQAKINLQPKTATVLHVNAKLGVTPPPPPPPVNCGTESMFIRGSFNSWGTTAMNCTSGKWEATIEFSSSDARLFKFDQHGDWSRNWGDIGNDGIGDSDGDNIYVAVPGRYRVTFNTSTLKFEVFSTAAAQAVRLENSGHGLWLQGASFADVSGGTQRNVQAVPTRFTGNKTKWRLVSSDEPGYYFIESVAQGMKLHNTLNTDVTNGLPEINLDSDTYAVSLGPTIWQGDRTKWRKVAAGNGFFRLENKWSGYYLQVTPLKDVDGAGIDAGQQVRAVPNTKLGDWTRFREVAAQ